MKPSFLVRFLMLLILLAGLARWVAHPVVAAEQPVRKLGVVRDGRINESSGLARSLRQNGWFWTHNDSGDSARLFLLDDTLKTRAVVNVREARAVDWEDLATFFWQRQPYLLIGDFGNNQLNRSIVQLYLVEEPVVAGSDDTIELGVPISRTISFQFSDGPKNCESLGVDVSGGRILLVSKESPTCGVYELPWPVPAEADGTHQVARRIATLPTSLATGMDISPDGKRMMVVNYLSGFLFERAGSESWATTLARPPRTLAVPLRRTGEAVCFNADGQRAYLSSEGTDQPVWELPLPPVEFFPEAAE